MKKEPNYETMPSLLENEHFSNATFILSNRKLQKENSHGIQELKCVIILSSGLDNTLHLHSQTNKKNHIKMHSGHFVQDTQIEISH